MADGDETYHDELLRVFRNGPDDLEANRLGVLGERQKQRLLRTSYYALLAWPALGLAGVALVVAVGAKPFAPIQWILMGLLFGGAVIGGVVGFRRRRIAAEFGRIECLTGPIRLWRPGRGAFRLSVADRDFPLPVAISHVKAGQSYRVFYAPHAKQIIAMEPDGWN